MGKLKQRQNERVSQFSTKYKNHNKIIFLSIISYLILRNPMINGIKPSEMDLRNRSLHIHYNKLSQIQTGHTSCISTFDKNFHIIVRKKKLNHIKWRNFKLNESQSQIWKQNQIVKDKIVSILTSKRKLSPYAQEVHQQSSKDFTKSNYFYERRRFQTSIDRQNPEIAKRIIKATGPLSHKKDFSDFQKSRQFVKRLERFPLLKRLQQNIQSSRFRFKTEEKFNSRNASSSSKSIQSRSYFRHES